MIAWLPPEIYELLRLKDPLPPIQCTASGIGSVARGTDDTTDVLWFNAKGTLAGAEAHHDSRYADADWSGFTLAKSTVRTDGGPQAIVSLSLGPDDEHVFWVRPNGKILYLVWAPVK